MADRPARGLLDTSVVIDLGAIPAASLPIECAISTITLAELATGPYLASDPTERGRRQELLQRVEATFNPLTFDAAAARAYGRIASAVTAAGRTVRGPRAVDLLIAATALVHELPLVTRNAADLDGLDDLLGIVEI